MSCKNLPRCTWLITSQTRRTGQPVAVHTWWSQCHVMTRWLWHISDCVTMIQLDRADSDVICHHTNWCFTQGYLTEKALRGRCPSRSRRMARDRFWWMATIYGDDEAGATGLFEAVSCYVVMSLRSGRANHLGRAKGLTFPFNSMNSILLLGSS